MVLDLPAKFCISRSVKRIGYEGNLQGGKAAAVVKRKNCLSWMKGSLELHSVRMKKRSKKLY